MNGVSGCTRRVAARMFTRMKSVVRFAVVLCAALLGTECWSRECWAIPTVGIESGVRIEGRSDAIVTAADIRLGDIASISSLQPKDDEAIVALRKIRICESPSPGETKVLAGNAILERLKSEGVRLDQVRYTLSREVSVTRAYREISLDELNRALTSFLRGRDDQLDVKKLLIDKPVRVPPDASNLEVVDLTVTQPGHIGIDYRAKGEGDEVRFQLRGVADQWRMMPVAARPLHRGTIVSGEDVVLRRINGTSAGIDVLENLGDVVGRSVTRDIGEGEMFRSSTLVIPPVITAGSRVTLLFKSNGLEATATGTAIDNGVEGQEIRIRNESSKKVIVGRVSQPGLVTVGGK